MSEPQRNRDLEADVAPGLVQQERSGTSLFALSVFAALLAACVPSYTQVSHGGTFVCGIRADTMVDCWSCIDMATRHESAPADGGYLRVSAGVGMGPHHACALAASGAVVCWGDDVADETHAPGGDFIDVSAGSLFACGIRSDHTLDCWGSNDQGEATPPEGEFKRVSAGLGYACAIRTDDSIACWGRGGLGSEPPSAAVDLSPPSTGTFAQVSAEYLGGCALDSAGSVVCWGLYAWPEGGTRAYYEGLTVTELSTGSCVLLSDGQPNCNDISGDISGATSGYSEYIAGPPPGKYVHVAAQPNGLSSGGCGILEDGRLTCWGQNSSCGFPR